MSLAAQIARVQRAERALEASRADSIAQWRQLKTLWRISWTPGRIVIAGLAAGFAVGRARPLRLASSGGLLNLVSALSGLFAAGSAQAAAAANPANPANEEASPTAEAAQARPFETNAE